MRTLLVFDVAGDAVVALRRQRGSATPVGRQSYAHPSDVTSAIRLLLAAVPKQWRRDRVRIRLGFPFAQVKRLERLPPVSARVATRIVRANRDAFFMRCRGDHAIAGVRIDGSGALWAAAFDGALVADITTLLRTNGFTVERFEPMSELLSESAREHPESFAWRPAGPTAARQAAWRIERMVATVTIAIAGAAALFSPALHAHHEHAGFAIEVQHSAAVRLEASHVHAELVNLDKALNTIGAFDGQRGALTALFAAIGTAVPDSTAITTLQIDSTEASFVAVSPHVVDVLAAVSEALPGRELRIASVVTREQLGGLRVERATFRSSRPRKARRSSSAAQTAMAR